MRSISSLMRARCCTPAQHSSWPHKQQLGERHASEPPPQQQRQMDDWRHLGQRERLQPVPLHSLGAGFAARGGNRGGAAAAPDKLLSPDGDEVPRDIAALLAAGSGGGHNDSGSDTGYDAHVSELLAALDATADGDA